MKKWIGFVAMRYVKRDAKTNRRAKGPSEAMFFMSAAGIAAGVLVLTVILAVMNGFQLGFIESILEISSYHVRLELEGENGAPVPPEAAQPVLENAAKVIEQNRFVRGAVPFAELRGIVRGKLPQTQQGAVIRALPTDALYTDTGMAKKITFEEGAFNLHDENSILLGAELASRLGVSLGGTVTFLSLTGIAPGAALQSETEGTLDSSFTVRGIFRSGFYEYDLGWAFISLEKAKKLDENLKLILGVKINDRFAAQSAMSVFNSELPARYLLDNQTIAHFSLTSWRDYNKAFFGALRTEKLFMFILVGLIFIVVGIQIFQSQRRLVLERSDEIGLLRAVGAGSFDVRCIFTLNGFIIGGIGAGAGTALALLVAGNIQPIFGTLERIVNAFIRLANGRSSFAVFSPSIFYIKDIPSRIIPYEVLLIFLFGFVSAVFAGWFASRRAANINPAEILRYE